MSLLDTASLVITPNGTKAGKLYSVVPSSGAGDMTVTRATTATRVNSAGLIESVASNVPRLDYSNGTCPSILVEPQRTNLLVYSEQFDNLLWNKFSTNVGADSIVSPSGINNADKLLEDATDNYHGLNYSLPITPIGTNTLSLYAKEGERNWIMLYIFDSVLGSLFAWFNVANGTIGTVQSGLTANIENAGNGWYRCSITRTQSNVGNGGFIISQGNNGLQYQGNGTSGLYIWGAQLEAGSYATSYIPTTSASVTRNADVISKTGISSLIGQTEGTMFFDYNKTHASDEALLGITYLDANPSNNRLQVVIENNYFYMYASIGGALSLLSGNINLLSGRNKIAISYGSNGYKIYLNGYSVYTNATTLVPSTDSFRLGSYASNIAFMSDSINQSTLWKTQLTNTQLAQLTTI